jgi:hypothetical protein
MDWFTQFDAWTISFIERRFTHPTQRWFGLDNFDLMPWLFLCFCVTFFFFAPNTVFAGRFASLLTIAALFLPIECMLLGLFYMKPDELRARKNGCANPWKNKPIIRLVPVLLLLSFTFPLVYGLWSELSVTIMVAALLVVSSMTILAYMQLLLATCDPLKPRKSKLKEFLESFASQRELKPIRVRK